MGAWGFYVAGLASGQIVYLKFFHTYFCIQIIHVKGIERGFLAKRASVGTYNQYGSKLFFFNTVEFEIKRALSVTVYWR